jgi:hypothetical protein
MLAVLMLVNILVFCGGVFMFIHKAAPGLNRGVKNIAAIVMVFTLVSYAYYLSLAVKIDIIILADIFTLISLILVAFNAAAYKKIFTTKRSTGINNRDTIFPLVIVLILTCYFFIDGKRWGEGDAITIWNLHAKFLFDANTWKLLFKNSPHPDYPLMLPAIFSFFWRTIDNISPFIPVIFAYFQLIFIPLLVYFSLYNSKNNWFAWVGMFVFVISSNFINVAFLQGADTLLSLFILLTFILYNHLKSSSSNLAFYIGFTAAASTWVKNEGILFLVMFTLVFIVVNRRNRGYLIKYALGTLIPLLALASFKFLYAPQNDLVGNADNTSLLLHHLVDYHRYFIIARYLCSTLFYFYADVLILLIAVVIINRQFFKSPLFVVILLAMAGYFMIYVTSPFDLHWHLATSADRVLQHFYPALVYAILLSLQAWYTKRRGANAVS